MISRFPLPAIFAFGGLGARACAAEVCNAPATGGSWPAHSLTPSALAAITLNNEELTLALLGIFASLIGYHLIFRRYIREAAGLKETQQTEIAGQPVTIKTEVEFVPVPDFQRLEKYVHEREHSLRNDLQTLHDQIELRRQESADQITDLRSKLEAGVDKAIAASNSSASRIHKRIDDLASVQGQLVGKMELVVLAANKAADAAQAAALESVRKGARA